MPLLGVGACVSVQFAVVGALKRLFSRQNLEGGHPAKLTHGQMYVAGAGAGLANSFIAGPVEHIRIRMQTQRTQMYKGPFDCLAKIMRQTGIGGVFRGLVPTMLRESHGAGVYVRIAACACRANATVPDVRVPGGAQDAGGQNREAPAAEFDACDCRCSGRHCCMYPPGDTGC